MTMFWLATLYLIFVHGPAGHEIEINVAEISSLRQPEALPESHLPEGTKCVVVMSNAKSIYTKETCREVINKIGVLEKEKTQ